MLAALLLYTHMHQIVSRFGAEDFEALVRGQTNAGPLAGSASAASADSSLPSAASRLAVELLCLRPARRLF